MAFQAVFCTPPTRTRVEALKTRNQGLLRIQHFEAPKEGRSGEPNRGREQRSGGVEDCFPVVIRSCRNCRRRVRTAPFNTVWRKSMERTDYAPFVDDESRFLGRRAREIHRNAKDYKGKSGVTREPRPFCSSTTLSLRIHSTG